MLPLSTFLPHDAHPFPVVQNGRWDYHLQDVFDSLTSPLSESVDALQIRCQEWWSKFKYAIARKISTAMKTAMTGRKSQEIALKQQALLIASNHAFTQNNFAISAYNQKKYQHAIDRSLRAVQLELPLWEQAAIATPQLLEALLLIGQSKFMIAYSKKSTFISWSDVVMLMKDAKRKVHFALELSKRRSPQLLGENLYDIYLLLAEIALFEMDWKNALDYATKALEYFPLSMRAVDIMGTAKWRGGVRVSNDAEDSDHHAAALKAEIAQKQYQGQNKWDGIEWSNKLFCLWRNISCESFWHLGAKGELHVRKCPMADDLKQTQHFREQ